MDPTRFPHLYRYNAPVPQYTYNPIAPTNYGWPNTYPNYLSSFPMIPLYSYPNVQMYNQSTMYDHPLFIPGRFPQPNIVPAPRLPFPNHVYGIPQTQTQTTTQIIATEPAHAPEEAMKPAKTVKPFARNSKLRWSINHGHSKNIHIKPRESNYIPRNNATDHSETIELLRKAARKSDRKLYTAAGKVASKYMKRRSKNTKLQRARNVSHNTTAATTELSAIANDGNYKNLAIIVSDNGDPNDSEFETCDESEDDVYEESNWNIEEKESNENSGQGQIRKFSTSMDYTVIANDKSYSHIDYNPAVSANLKNHQLKRLDKKALSQKMASLVISKQSTPTETTNKAQGSEKFTKDKIISRVIEEASSAALMDKSRSPELWWDKSTDLGYDVISKGKSPAPSLKEDSTKEMSARSSEALTDSDENGHLTMAKAHDYEVIELFDFNQKHTKKDQNDNESTLTQSKTGPALLNSKTQCPSTATFHDVQYNVPNNTAANFDSVLNDSHKINQTAPEVRSTYQQRKLLEVDWNAIQSILKNMGNRKTKQTNSNVVKSSTPNVINPSISGQDSAILAYGKVSKINSENKISESERDKLFSKYPGTDSFNFPPTQFGSDHYSNKKIQADIEPSRCGKNTANSLSSKSKNCNSNVDITKSKEVVDVSKHKNETYLVMHATLPSTPVNKKVFGSMKNQSLQNPLTECVTPMTSRAIQRRPSTCTKVPLLAGGFLNESARSVSFPSLVDDKSMSLSISFKTGVKRKLPDSNPTEIPKVQGKSIEHEKKDLNLVTNVTPTNKITSRKKFEMIRDLFVDSKQSSNNDKIKKTYTRRSLPANLNKTTHLNGDNQVSVEAIDVITNSEKGVDEDLIISSPKLRRVASTNLLATPNKLVKAKPNSLKTSASMLNLTTPTRKNKLLYEKAKPPSTPFFLKQNILSENRSKFPESKSAPSTPSAIIKNHKIHTYEIDIGEKSGQIANDYESAIAKHAEIVTIDDVAASFTGNEGDDEASSVSTKNSEHRFDPEMNDKISSANVKINKSFVKDSDTMKLVTAKPEITNTSNATELTSKTEKIVKRNVTTKGINTIPTKLPSFQSKDKVEITQTASKLASSIHAPEKVCEVEVVQTQQEGNETKTSPQVRLTADSAVGIEQENPTKLKNPNFSAEKIQTLKEKSNIGEIKSRVVQKNALADNKSDIKSPPVEPTKDQKGLKKINKNTTKSSSNSADNQSTSYCNTTTPSCQDYDSLSIDGDSGFSLLNAEESLNLVHGKPLVPFNTPQMALFQAGLGRMRPNAMIQSSSMLLLGQVPFPNSKQAKVKPLRTHCSQPSFAQPPTLVQPIAGAKPLLVSNHTARNNISMDITGNASAYQVYPCLAYKPVTNPPRYKYGSVNKFRKTNRNRSFSIPSRSYINNKNSSMNKQHFINVQKTTMNFSHPPLTVINTSLEHPKISALKARDSLSRPQKPARKRLAAVCKLSKEDMQNIAKVKTPPKIATLKINLSDPENKNHTSSTKSNSSNGKADNLQMTSRQVGGDVGTPSTGNDVTATVTLCDDTTPTNSSKTKSKKWRSFFPRITTPNNSEKGEKYKTPRSGSIMKKTFRKSKRMSKSVTTTSALQQPKDYCEINRALYKATFLCMAPIESKTQNPTNLSSTKEEVFIANVHTPNQPNSNVADYFGREFTSSTATIKHRSVRQSVGSTPGVRINSVTGDILDHTRGFGTFLCSTTIGDVAQDKETNNPYQSSFEGSSIQIHQKLFTQTDDSLDCPKDCSTEIN